MSVSLLTSRDAVLDAIGEWDALGREAFLQKYGYGSAKSYFVQHNGRAYDSKAIAGVAVGKQFPDRGALRNNEFSGGESVKQKLESLGFEFISEVKLTAADIALLKQSRTKGRYADLTDDERNAYIRITSALTEVGRATLATLGDEEYQLKLTAGFNLGSGVRGGIPKDLWFGIYAKENAEKFVRNPQLFLIVSERGVELGFSASTHPSGFSDASIKAKMRAAAPTIFDLMPPSTSEPTSQLSSALDKAGGWHFRRQTRLLPNDDDFVTLSDWLDYLHSGPGKADAGGSVSKYLTPSELEHHDLVLEAVQAAEIFRPLMQTVRAAGSTSAHVSKHSALFATQLTAFLQEFSAARSQPYGVVQPLWSSASHLRQWLQDFEPVKFRPKLSVSWSAGKGVWARVPWIAILNRDITTTTQQGLYCAFLVAQDLSSVYLTLTQGVTELTNELGPAAANEALNKRAARFRSELPELTDAGFTLANDVDLKCDGRLARGYEQSVIAYVKFDAANPPTDAELHGHLEPLLAAYDKLAQLPEFELSGAEPPNNDAQATASDALPWTIDDAMSELFLTRTEFERMLRIWAPKKNLVLQGAPGVGKTFLAKRLAYTLIGAKDPSRVESVQFHQSYGYEDFVQGYRPDGFGGFVLKNGIFYDFCEKARSDASKRYVFIIDEINRGNLSKIFGELMLLIEHDKRSGDWAARLAYGGPDAPRFYVPANLYVLGMMNTADRSLSLVDYALRRRFSFATLEPQFQSAEFRTKLESLGVSGAIIDTISQRMSHLNELISNDTMNLGRGFRIGHSFFVPAQPVTDSVGWYKQIVDTEVRPLLEEYWLDDSDKVESLCGGLLDSLP